jgi:hypothetical protein
MDNISFNIQLVDGWEDLTAYVFRGPMIDDFDHRIILNIDRQLQHDDIVEYSQEKINPIVQTMTGIDVLKDEEITFEGGNPAYEFVYKYILSDELFQIHKYSFIIKDNLGFSLNVCFTKKSYKILKEQVKEIIESIVPGTYLLNK